jgi:phosphocarrier protein HPr
MLAAGLGSEVEVEVEGPDEAQALQALVQLIDDRFGEGE